MGILRDWREDNEGYYWNRQVIYFFSPKVWLRLHKWRKQRANRGWSDRDTWGAGDHIAKITAEILQHLNEESYTDWPRWFEYNVQEKGIGTYKDLQSVIDDINGYLEFEANKSWSDGLDTSSDNSDYKQWLDKWVDATTRKPVTEKQIRARMKKHYKESARLYKKATKAMQFFGRNFTQFWD